MSARYQLDLDRLRSLPGNRIGTHYEGCEYVHLGCAIFALCAEVERLRSLVEAFDRFHASDFVDPMGSQFEWEDLLEKRAALDHDESSLRGKDGRTDEEADDGR